MNEQDIFIGREKELKMFDEMVFDPEGLNHMFMMVAKGGVGKTWLLRELYQRYKHNPNIVVIKIDYGESRFQNMSSLFYNMFRDFQDYISDSATKKINSFMSHWGKSIESDDSSDIIQEEQRKSFQYMIQFLMTSISGKRLVLLVDTIDARESLVVAERTISLGPNFKNVVLIGAGRPVKTVINTYEMGEKIYREAGWVVHGIYDLESFSSSETVQYFEAALEGEMPPDLRDKIFLLTDGNPVLIAIAGEWLKRHIKLPKDVDLALSDLQALDEPTLSKRRLRFEFSLVEKLRSLPQLIDWATLYLAYLNRRYDPKILQLVLDLDESELKEVTEGLKSLVFVRKSMSAEGGLLHDEARRLIRQHAWPVADPDGEIRREAAQEVIEGYYLPEIERLSQIVQTKLAQSVEHKLIAPERRRLPPIPDEDWLKRELQIECLDYHFRISEEKGREYLNELFDEALNHHYSLIQMDAIIQAVHNLAPEQADSAQFKVRVAETLLAKGKLNDATTMAESVLNKPEISASNAARALMVLGHTISNPTSKIQRLQAALERAQQGQEQALEAQALKLLGLAYRRQGKWPEAAKYYQQGLRLLNEEKEPDQYANTLNNLAFVTMLSGNPTRADIMAEKALRIRKEQGNLHGLALSYATKGRIAEALGHFERAVRYHRIAVDLAQSVGDLHNVALFQTNIAKSERFAHNFVTARELLSAGLESQRPHICARAYLELSKINRDEASVLQFRGARYEDILAKYDSAEQKAQRALELAVEVGDEHQEASILLELALLTYYREQREDKEHIQKLREILKQRNYTLEKGYLTELMGHLAYTKGNLLTAFETYLEACELFSGYSPASFEQTFQRVRDKYLDASPEMQEQICQLIEKKFATVHPASPLARLKELCAFADF